MKNFTIICCFFLLFCGGGLLYAADSEYLNISDENLALEGYDPVSYHTGSPKRGTQSFSLIHDDVRYYFSSHENMTLFQKDPKTFKPAFGGWCAWAMLEGKKVKVDPERFKIVDGSTYLYYNTFFTDTLKKWDELAEKETEEVLVQKAHENWQKILTSK